MGLIYVISEPKIILRHSLSSNKPRTCCTSVLSITIVKYQRQLSYKEKRFIQPTVLRFKGTHLHHLSSGKGGKGWWAHHGRS